MILVVEIKISRISNYKTSVTHFIIQGKITRQELLVMHINEDAMMIYNEEISKVAIKLLFQCNSICLSFFLPFLIPFLTSDFLFLQDFMNNVTTLNFFFYCRLSIETQINNLH